MTGIRTSFRAPDLRPFQRPAIDPGDGLAPATPAARPDQAAAVEDPATSPAEPMAITNPVLEAYYTALTVHDPRFVPLDRTPRGVEIDRIEMIEAGFAHIHAMIAAISAETAHGAEPPAVDIAL